jgi:hypothetical protein
MTKSILFAASVVAIGSLGWLVGNAAEDKKKDKDERSAKKLAAEEIALAERAISLGMEGFRASRIRLSDAQVERWSLRRIDALKAADASDKDLQKAREAHRELMKSLEKLAESLFKSAQAAEIDYLEAKYARLEADRQLGKYDEDGDSEEGDEGDKKKQEKQDKKPREKDRARKGE